MLYLFLICFFVGGGLSETGEICLKISGGEVSPALFGTPGTREFGSEIPVSPVVTHMSL